LISTHWQAHWPGRREKLIECDQFNKDTTETLLNLPSFISFQGARSDASARFILPGILLVAPQMGIADARGLQRRFGIAQFTGTGSVRFPPWRADSIASA
jgi:hypothetical protein